LSYVSGDSASISSAATALGASSPDIIIFIGLDDGVSLIRQAVQDLNLLSVPWFLSHGVRSESLRTLFSSSNPKPEFFFGVTYASRTGVVFDRFAEAYRDAYKKQDGPEVWREHAYDATYLAAYALSGIEDEISGTAFAKSMTQLSA
jgi:ABC-type branched-subunit amino acid transport system substrate-binding protein